MFVSFEFRISYDSTDHSKDSKVRQIRAVAGLWRIADSKKTFSRKRKEQRLTIGKLRARS
jgi:hypothetical protein